MAQTTSLTRSKIRPERQIYNSPALVFVMLADIGRFCLRCKSTNLLCSEVKNELYNIYPTMIYLILHVNRVLHCYKKPFPISKIV